MSGPWTLSGRFFGGENGYLELIDNEMRTAQGAWDVELMGPHLTIRQGPGRIALQLKIQNDCIQLKRLELRWQASSLIIDSDGTLIAESPSGRVKVSGCRSQGGRADFCSLVKFWDPLPKDVAQIIETAGSCV